MEDDARATTETPRERAEDDARATTETPRERAEDAASRRRGARVVVASSDADGDDVVVVIPTPRRGRRAGVARARDRDPEVDARAATRACVSEHALAEVACIASSARVAGAHARRPIASATTRRAKKKPASKSRAVPARDRTARRRRLHAVDRPRSLGDAPRESLEGGRGTRVAVRARRVHGARRDWRRTRPVLKVDFSCSQNLFENIFFRGL